MTIPATTPTGFLPIDAERVQNQADLNSLLAAFSGGFLRPANGGLGTSPLTVYANNAAAVAGGLAVGAFYRTGADPDPVCVVH